MPKVTEQVRKQWWQDSTRHSASRDHFSETPSSVSTTLLTSCKTQNSGLRSKEEKPRNPINQPSRCNTQEGLLSVAPTGDSELLGGRAHQTANWASFLYAKKPYYQHITYGLQSDWLHVCKAILLVQTSRATCLQSNPIGTNFAGFCSNLKQFYWYKGRGLVFKLRRPLAFQLSRGLLLGAS